MIKKSRKNEKGITLIALVITIIVLLILSGVSIALLTGDNGILTQAKASKISTTLATYKEELELYKGEKRTENINFLDNSLNAGKVSLSYNTQKENEDGNIRTVITQINEEYIEKIEIIKGELLINTKNKQELEIARGLGIRVNPYEIIDGELTSSDGNYIEKIEIIKGELLINTKNKQELEIARGLGIRVNPYEIIDGELTSSDGNLLLMDKNGTLIIPDSVTKIGEGAFANVSGLKTIIIPGTVKEISERAFAYNQTLERVVLEEGIEIIKENCFQNCYNLKEINLPNSLKYIGGQAFYYCTSLKEITLPPNIEKLESWTFGGNKKLEQINLNEGLKIIGSYTFCDTLFNKITIPSTVEEIGLGSFDRNTNLDEIIVKEENKKFMYENGMLIGKNEGEILFMSSKNFENISTFKIPEGIRTFSTSIQRYNNITKIIIILFMSSKNFENISTFKIPEGIRTFSTSIQRYNNITKIIIPSTLERMGDADELPESIKEIEVSPENKHFAVSTKDKILYTKDRKELISCFSKDENINIDVNNEIGILKLNRWAFLQATNVKIVTLPKSLTSIDAQSFSDNRKLEELKIGKNVSEINPIFKFNNYSGKVTIDPNNNYYTIEDNILYNKSKEKLVAVLSEINGPFSVKETVKEIGDLAFHGQRKMTSVNISSNVTRIGNSFNYCEFSEIEIPKNVEYIGASCFKLNQNLERIKIHKEENSIPGAPWGAVKGIKVLEWK